MFHTPIPGPAAAGLSTVTGQAETKNNSETVIILRTLIHLHTPNTHALHTVAKIIGETRAVYSLAEKNAAISNVTQD